MVSGHEKSVDEPVTHHVTVLRIGPEILPTTFCRDGCRGGRVV